MEDLKDRKIVKEKPKGIDWKALGFSSLSWFLQGAAMAAGGVAINTAVKAMQSGPTKDSSNVVSFRKTAT